MRVKKNRPFFFHKIRKSLPFIRYSVLLFTSKCREKKPGPLGDFVNSVYYVEEAASRPVVRMPREPKGERKGVLRHFTFSKRKASKIKYTFCSTWEQLVVSWTIGLNAEGSNQDGCNRVLFFETFNKYT